MYQFPLRLAAVHETIDIHVRDYKALLRVYERCLEPYLRQKEICKQYLVYCQSKALEKLFREWSEFKCKSAPLTRIIRKYDVKTIRQLVDEKDPNTLTISVADFVALSMIHYLHRIPDPNLCTMDRTLFSVLLSYFGERTLSKQRDLPRSIPSGLFTKYLISDNGSDDADGIKVDALSLKESVVRHLHKESFNVAIRYFSATLLNERVGRVTFFLQDIPESEVLNTSTALIDIDKLTFETNGFFSVEGRMDDPNGEVLKGFLLILIDTSFAMDWATWVRKPLPEWTSDTFGFWEVMDRYQPRKRISNVHLDAILSLLRHNAWPEPPKRRIARSINIVFLNNGKRWKQHFQCDDITAEYKVTFWNGTPNGTAAIALNVLKPSSDQMRSYYYVYYQSRGDIEWFWYDNDHGKYRRYKDKVMKQLECSYQAIINFSRDGEFRVLDHQKNGDRKSEKLLFNCAQIWELTMERYRANKENGKKPYLLRMQFDAEQAEITNIEQIKMNAPFDRYSRSVLRKSEGKRSIFGQEDALWDIGCLLVTQYGDDDLVSVTIVFKRDEENGIMEEQHFSCLIQCHSDGHGQRMLRRLLLLWRNDNLLQNVVEFNRLRIIQSEQSHKYDSLCPQLFHCPAVDGQNGLAFADVDSPLTSCPHMMCLVCHPKATFTKIQSLQSNPGMFYRKFEWFHDSEFSVNDQEWDQFDEWDLQYKCHDCNLFSASNPLQQKWKETHYSLQRPDKFYEYIGLRKIQRILSMMKMHVEKHSESVMSNPMIIVLSDRDRHQILFPQWTMRETSLFDDDGDIKSMDREGSIYSLNVPNFKEQIVCSNYFHKFVCHLTEQCADTMFIFTRCRRRNLYISFHGMVSMLSLERNFEDLHYFLPQFIPLSKGCSTAVMAFNAVDRGTVIEYEYDDVQKEIMYNVRCHNNVHYKLNYHQICNRVSRREYYSTKRSALSPDSLAIFGRITRIKSPVIDDDTINSSCLLHTLSLAVMECSRKLMIPNPQVTVMDEFLEEMSQKAEFAKDTKLKLHALVDEHSFDSDAVQQDVQNPIDSNLCQLLGTKSLDTIIRQISSSRDISHEVFHHQLAECGVILLFYRTLEMSSDDEVLKRKECQELEDGKRDEEGSNTMKKWISKLLKDLEDQNCVWNKERSDGTLSYQELCRRFSNVANTACKSNRVIVCHVMEHRHEKWVEADIANAEEDTSNEDSEEEWLRLDSEDGKIIGPGQVVVETSYETKIEYEFEICADDEAMSSLHGLLSQSKDCKEPDDEDRELLSRLSNCGIYNGHDLRNKSLLKKARKTLTGDSREIKTLRSKFQEFHERLLEQYDFLQSSENTVIETVEVSRNVRYLRQYIERWRTSNERKRMDTLIVGYNPLQTTVSTSNSCQEVTHPIHLYRSAHDEHFVSDFQLKDIYTEWMLPGIKMDATKKRGGTSALRYAKERWNDISCTVIDGLSTLIRYNKKYEVILVPSFVSLDPRFVEEECVMMPPHHLSISKYRVSFLYRGAFYRFDEGRYLLRYYRTSAREPSISSVKGVMERLNAKIQHDAMLYEYASTHYAATKEERAIRRFSNQVTVWLSIGNGECHRREWNVRSKRIRADYKEFDAEQFAKELQKLMFLESMDCKIPYSDSLVAEEQRCGICNDFCVKASCIGNERCSHTFCYECICCWRQNMMRSRLKPQFAECPKCGESINEIVVDEAKGDDADRGYPMTLQRQMVKESKMRGRTLVSMEQFVWDNERCIAEGADSKRLQEQYRDNPELEYMDAGYGQ